MRSVGGRHVVWLLLDEVRDRIGDPPDLLVQAPVNPWGAVGDPERAQDFAHLCLCSGLGGI